MSKRAGREGLCRKPAKKPHRQRSVWSRPRLRNSQPIELIGMEIHQLVSGIHPGDAISNHALSLRNLLRSWGHVSDIYARDISPAIAHECHPFSTLQPSGNAITIYHYSMDFDDMTRLFLGCAGKRMFIYHNITPARYMLPYNEAVARACAEGRDRLAEV